MIPAYNKKRCAAFPFEMGIHFRRKTDFLSEEDTTKSYSGFEPKPTRLQAEGHSHHTGWATLKKHLETAEAVARYRLITGHDFLEVYLHRIGLATNETCPLGCQNGWRPPALIYYTR
ncbi:hypothetical protein TNCV_2340091 [Trichonephila clavipes]|nr:hypothetical protein TNCV_2340091 [Trichonephila clavipes]